VVCTDGSTIRATRVTTTGVSESRVVAEGRLRGLEWTGRDYVLVIRTTTGAYGLMRLDRDGRPLSGTVQLSEPSADLSIACGDTRCMVATGTFGVRNSSLRGAVVNESDFPPIGSVRQVRTLPLLNATFIELGYSDLGFYSVSGEGDGLVMRSYGPLRGTFSGRALRFRTPQRRVLQTGESRAVTASNGSDIHVAAGPLHRITPTGVETVFPSRYRTILGIVAGPSETLVFWGDGSSSDLVYLTRVSDTSFTDDSTLVSVGLPLEFMPRLARGHSTLLAAWLEGSPTSSEIVQKASLYYSVLDLDGRPLTDPVLLDDDAKGDAVIAFDGVNFLILWWSDWNDVIYGHLISQNGRRRGTRLVPDCHPNILTLVWSRNVYVTSCSGLKRVAPSGTVLDARPQIGSSDAMLVRDEEQDLLRGLEFSFESSDFSAGTQLFATYSFVSIDDRTLPLRVVDYGRSTPQVGVDQNALPGVAVGGGSEIGVFQDGLLHQGLLYLIGSKRPLPYPPPTAAFHLPRLHAHWSGREFIIVAGKTLARHAPDGTLLGTLSLGEDVGDAAAVGDGPDAVIVLRQRGQGHSIEAMRVNVPAN